MYVETAAFQSLLAGILNRVCKCDLVFEVEGTNLVLDDYSDSCCNLEGHGSTPETQQNDT